MSEQAAFPPPGKGTCWALLVGIDEYEDSLSFGGLRTCVNDATQLREQLITGGVPVQHINLLTDRTSRLPNREEILGSLQAIAESADEEDLLLFYISGHGEVEHGQSYLVPSNARSINLRDTAIPIKRVKEIIAASKARARVIILDTCHSGAKIDAKGRQTLRPEFLQATFAEAEGLAILSSCAAGQYSYDWPEKENSVFTYYLLEALRGKADPDDKGFVTVSDVNRYISYHVKVWALERQKAQRPTLQYEVVGDIILLDYKVQNQGNLSPDDIELLTRYFGSLPALREGRLRREFIRQLVSGQNIVSKEYLPQSAEDILERYNRVPLHAVLLYTSEDEEIIAYVKKHFASIQSLFKDSCDLHLFIDQFSSPQNYNAYTIMHELQMVKQSELPFYVELPAFVFWDHFGGSLSISFADFLEESAIKSSLRVIRDEIHLDATIDALRRAKAKVQRSSTRKIDESQLNSPIDGKIQERTDQREVDIGILIALPEEFDIFFSFIQERTTIKHQSVEAESFFLFECPSRSGNRPYRCVAGLIGEKGPLEAALSTFDLIKQWKPCTMVMLGIAAAIDEEMHLGDVVVARSIDNYLDQGKVRSNSKLQRPHLDFSGQAYQCSRSFIDFLHTFKYTHSDLYKDWQQNCSAYLDGNLHRSQIDTLKQEDSLRILPIYKSGPLASGPLVVGSSYFKDVLRKRNRDFLGVEMEAGGMMTAIRGYPNPLNSLVLRGISDFGDERKKDLEKTTKNALRAYAMYAVTQLFWHLTKTGIFPYTSQPQMSKPVNIQVSSAPAQMIVKEAKMEEPKSEDFNFLYNILKELDDELELKEISYSLHVNFNTLNGGNLAARAFSLTQKMKNQLRLNELEAELRARFPNRFKC